MRSIELLGTEVAPLARAELSATAGSEIRQDVNVP